MTACRRVVIWLGRDGEFTERIHRPKPVPVMVYYLMGKASRKKSRQVVKSDSRIVGKAEGGNPEQRHWIPGQARNDKSKGLLYRPVLHLLIICALGFLAYSNTFHGPFQWDEADFIAENPIVKDLAFFRDISRAEGLPVYDGLKSRYIGYLTFALNYKLHGLEVFGYHVVNLAIHLINAMLVYFLIVLTLRTPYFGNGQWAIGNNHASRFTSHVSRFTIHASRLTSHDSRFTIHHSRFFALLVTLLFVSHPIQTEAVTYVFQRLASLAGMFFLLSLVLYVKGRLWARGNGQWEKDEVKPIANHPSPIAHRLSPIAWFFLSLLFAVLAMKTKENAFTLPLIITLYEFLFFTGPLKPRIIRLVPFLLTMLIVPLTIMGTGSTPGEIISQVKDPVSQGYVTPAPDAYLFTQFRVIVTYIRLLFLPVGQNIDHDYPLYQSFFDPPVLLSFLFLSALFGAAVWLLYRSRQGAMGYGQEGETEGQVWQGAMGYGQEGETERQKTEDAPLNPPLARGEVKGGISPIAYCLLPIAYLRLIAFGILWFFITLSVESSIIPIPMLIDEYRLYLPSVGFFIAVVSGAVLFLQKFTKTTISRTPSPQPSPPRGEGVTVGASPAGGEVTPPPRSIGAPPLKLRGGEGELAAPPLRGGDEGEGDLRITHHASRITAFVVALFVVVILVLASATYARNMVWKDKVTLWEDVVRKSPGSPRGYSNLGIAYYDRGFYDRAMEMYERCLSLRPSHLQANINLGVAYAVTGRPDKAIQYFMQAIAIDPNSSVAYLNLGRAYSQMGRPDKAVENYGIAIELNPYNGSAYHGMGTAYVKLGLFDEAIAAYTKFAELSPGNPEAYRNRGNVHAYKGDFAAAAADYRQACSLGSAESCGYLQDPRFR